MRIDWIDGYILSKKGVVKDYKDEWECHRYLIGGKMLAFIGSHKDGKDIITLKCEPGFGVMLRDSFDDIIPGYYMNKEHWNSVYLQGTVPEDVLKQMIPGNGNEDDALTVGNDP